MKKRHWLFTHWEFSGRGENCQYAFPGTKTRTRTKCGNMLEENTGRKRGRMVLGLRKEAIHGDKKRKNNFSFPSLVFLCCQYCKVFVSN